MNKIIFFTLCIFILNGCMQSTAVVGPAVTFVSTGSVYNAGLSFGANKAVENETGMTTSEILSKKLKQNQIDRHNDLNYSLTTLIDLNYHKTREILINQNKIVKKK